MLYDRIRPSFSMTQLFHFETLRPNTGPGDCSGSYPISEQRLFVWRIKNSVELLDSGVKEKRVETLALSFTTKPPHWDTNKKTENRFLIFIVVTKKTAQCNSRQFFFGPLWQKTQSRFNLVRFEDGFLHCRVFFDLRNKRICFLPVLIISFKQTV